MTDTPRNPASAVPDGSSCDRDGSRLAADAHQYLAVVTDESDRTIEDLDRVIELLSTDVSSGSVEQELERRAAASGVLAVIAHDNPARLADRLPVLADELRLELQRTITDERSGLRDRSRAVRDNLVASMAHVIANDPTTIPPPDVFTAFTSGVTTDLTDGTIRAAANALFACANERAESVARATELLEKLLAHSDGAVQAWSAGTLGTLAEQAPDAVAPTADELHRLLDHEDGRVQHNAVEALGALVHERPDAVVPAADTLRELLSHDDVALRHNAAGVLGYLAKAYPDAVVPAAECLMELSTHEDEAVRRIATGALTRLAQERPEVVAND